MSCGLRVGLALKNSSSWVKGSYFRQKQVLVEDREIESCSAELSSAEATKSLWSTSLPAFNKSITMYRLFRFTAQCSAESPGHPAGYPRGRSRIHSICSALSVRRGASIGRIEALLSSVFFALMYYFIKASSHNAAQLAVVRGVGNMLILYVHSRITKESLFGSWKELDICCSRGALGVASIGFMIQSNKLLPISLYSILGRMNVFGILIMSMVYMGHRFSLKQLLLILGSVFGVTLVICPSIYGLDTSGSRGIEFNWTRDELLGLASAGGFIMMNGFARVFGSKFANDVGVCQSVFYLNLFLSLFYSLIVVYTPIVWQASEVVNYIGLSVVSYVYQLLFVDSMRREEDPNIIAIIQSSVILFSMAIDVVLLGNQLNKYNILGAAIVAGTTVLAMYKKKEDKKSPPR